MAVRFNLFEGSYSKTMCYLVKSKVKSNIICHNHYVSRVITVLFFSFGLKDKGFIMAKSSEVPAISNEQQKGEGTGRMLFEIEVSIIAKYPENT
jgi:hypothetical protein